MLNALAAPTPNPIPQPGRVLFSGRSPAFPTVNCTYVPYTNRCQEVCTKTVYIYIYGLLCMAYGCFFRAVWAPNLIHTPRFRTPF